MQERFIRMHHSKCFTILSILALSLIIVNVKINPVHATTATTFTTTTFQPTADTWIDEQSPNALDLPNWILEVAVSNNGGTQERERALLRFDISSIPAGSQILSATLSLYYYDSVSLSTSSPYLRIYWAYMLTQPAWDENLTTWNNYNATSAWTTPGGDYTTKDGASTSVSKYFGWMSWTVTNQVETQYSSGSGNANFIIKDGTESVGDNSSVGCDFISTESVISVDPSLAHSLEPVLTVKYSTYSDVAVTNVTSSKTVVGQGYDVNITVTVLNQGDSTETFNVTAYANTTAATSQNVTLSSGNSLNITLTWNTTGFAYGNYTISVYAWPVPGQTNTADDNFTSGVVRVTISGDLDGDFTVGLTDLVILANAYGSKPGDSNWNPNADIRGDGVVDLADLVILAQHYGEQYSAQEQIRDAVMAYIEANHPETAQFMQNLNWNGGSTTSEGIVGAETYSYTSDGWNVMMQYPVVPNAIYSITANYTTPGPPAHTTVAWQGTWQNGNITETSYNFTS